MYLQCVAYKLCSRYGNYFQHGLRYNTRRYSSTVELSLEHKRVAIRPLKRPSSKKLNNQLSDIINVTENSSQKNLQEKTILNLAKPTNFLKKINLLVESTQRIDIKKDDYGNTDMENILVSSSSNKIGFPDLEYNPHVAPYEITNRPVDIKDIIVVQQKVKRKKTNKKIQSDIAAETKKKEYVADIHKRKIYTINKNTEVFLNVCGQSDDTNMKTKAYSIFLKIVDKHGTLLEITAINEIFRCLLYQRQYTEVLDILSKYNIKPNVDTFCNLLSGLGSFSNPFQNCLSNIQTTLDLMKQQNISLETLLTNGSFSQESFNNCLEAAERVLPNIREEFKNFYCDKSTLQKKFQYSNRLVNQLNESLFTNSFVPPYQGLLTMEKMNKLMQDQIDIEVKGFEIIPSIADSNDSKSDEHLDKLLSEWEDEWRKNLRKTIESQKEFVRTNFYRHMSENIDIFPFLNSVKTEDIVNLLVLEIHRLSENTACVIPLKSLEKYIGEKLYNRFVISCKQKTSELEKFKQIYQKYSDWYINGSNQECSWVPRIQWEKFLIDSGATSLRNSPPEWPKNIQRRIGQFLYSCILTAVTIVDPETKDKTPFPAITKYHISEKKKNCDQIQVSPLLLKWYKKYQCSKLIMSSSEFPMRVPSLPWVTHSSGGYLLSKECFVRTMLPSDQINENFNEMGNCAIHPVLDSLNQLGSVPWRINKPMLDLIISIFNQNGWEELDLSSLNPSEEPPKCTPGMTYGEKSRLFHQQREYRKRKSEYYSNWCTTLYKLSLMNHFRDEVFWQPSNLDFRGRVYPITPHLNHLSADVFRSSLLFAQGKPLGTQGLHWLKLHTINLTGMKKRCSITERMEFIDEMIDEIMDSADFPLEGRQWWTKSDEPWQTLAACKELTSALRSPNPEEFVSHLPIHQDGSCNGLQHYAAISRDKMGGKSVNLKPSTIPQDIYSDVVNAVEKQRQIDATNGVPMATAVENYVTRKVIKQTIMTTVYGVTQYGAKLQIEKQLKYLDFDPKFRGSASGYLAKATFKSLEQLFTPTKEIQDWLVKCAHEISKDFESHVDWVTPLGFKVYQPYTVKVNRWGNINSDIAVVKHAKPDYKRHKNGFPPNYIHSLDSCHMMLTSIFCQKANINFASIHDCFWTHASTVPIMNEICRDQFVELHSLPLLEELSEYFQNKYEEQVQKMTTESILKEIPKKGDLDLNEVRKSVFFFS